MMKGYANTKNTGFLGCFLGLLLSTLITTPSFGASHTSEYSEKRMMELESVLGPINFISVSSVKDSKSIAKNAKNFEILRRAIYPFHQYVLNISTELMTEINAKGEVSPLNFNILDRALFGYQAILRKLIMIESAYSDIARPSLEIEAQVSLARAFTSILGADLHNILFNESKSRRMLKDLLDEERPKQAGYERRNQELQVLFVRSLENNYRSDLLISLRRLPIRASDLAPFSAKSLNDALSPKKSYSQFAFGDAISGGISDTTYLLSKLFGSVAGNIKFRKGHFYQRSDVTKYMAHKLRPFDILFDKAPFALTDNFIPGHYTHAAVYIGTKEQLQELGLWNHPSLKPFQKDIEAGKVIAEALRPGTKMSTLSSFQNVDEVAAYRVNGIEDDFSRMEIVLQTALAQIGKAYDFNFDVNTTSVIVCSELVYHAHAQINWPTALKLGSQTITPDNLAETAFYQGAPIELVFDIFAEAPGELRERSKVEVAGLLGFKEVAFDQFERIIQVCENVKKRHIRVGSRRERHLVMRQCHEETKEVVYN